MIISTKKGTPKEELEKIVDRFEKPSLALKIVGVKPFLHKIQASA